MFYRNNTLFGVAIGIFTVIVALAFILVLNDLMIDAGWMATPGGDAIYFSEQSVFVLAVFANMIPFTFYRRRRLDKTMTGILIITLCFTIAFAVWKLAFPSFQLGIMPSS